MFGGEVDGDGRPRGVLDGDGDHFGGKGLLVLPTRGARLEVVVREKCLNKVTGKKVNRDRMAEQMAGSRQNISL
jgi:hypothetical protein